MLNKRIKTLIASTLCAATGLSMVSTTVQALDHDAYTIFTNDYQKDFISLWDDIHSSSNNYFKNFSSLKVPYYSPETFIIEGPDYGHETTSDVYSYYLNLEAMYGKLTGQWTDFQNAWKSVEKFSIPNAKDQLRLQNRYTPDNPCYFYSDYKDLNKYPSQLMKSSEIGKDSLGSELKNTYGNNQIYGMHYLSDVDNWYGFGVMGVSSNYTAPSYIRTFERGPSESIFNTIVHPAYDNKNFGGKNGFLDLFESQDFYNDPRWTYTVNSDADAYAIQAAYYANKWADEQGKSSKISSYVSKASKMGDFLRYSFYDKFFKPIGIGSDSIYNLYGKHYLLSNGYTWSGSPLTTTKEIAYRYGNSKITIANQNPMTAWILSDQKKFAPKSPTGTFDWAYSLDRQLEFYQWLQTSEGPLALGATNSYITDSGSYQIYPEGTSTFYGLAYDDTPDYTNRDTPYAYYFGNQVKSIEHLADYYNETGDKRAEEVLEKWFNWLFNDNELLIDGAFQVPKYIIYDGQPDTWEGTSTGNFDLHALVSTYSSDIGIAASIVNASLKYLLGCNRYTDSYNENYLKIVLKLLNVMKNNYKDDKGYSTEEPCMYYKVFEEESFIPENWTGKMPNGDIIKYGNKFLDTRLKYKNDPDFLKVETAYNYGIDSVFNYHRFTDEAEIALAFGNAALALEELDYITPLPPSPPAVDINKDGKINIKDYIYLQKYITNCYSLKLKDPEAADINCDGKINVTDLMLLKKMIF